MRKISFGLGLAGTIITLVIALIMLTVAIAVTVISNVDFDKFGTHTDEMELYFDKYDKDWEFDEDSEKLYFDKDDFRGHMGTRFTGRLNGDFDGMPRLMLGFLSGWLWFATAVMLVAGALGVVGTVITRRRKSTAAGVLLLVAAVLSLSSFIASGLLISSGVLAFIKDKSEKEEVKA